MEEERYRDSSDHSDQSKGDDDSIELASLINEVEEDRPVPPRTKWRVLMDGPIPPRQPSVSMIFPKYQKLPEHLPIPEKHRTRVFYAAVVLWAGLFYILAKWSLLSTAIVDNEPAITLRCAGGHEFWQGKDNTCGINATNCIQPIGKQVRFRCPADCVKESWTYSEFAVGRFESVYRPYVVGSRNTYRADSFICGSAAHHGAISDTWGGGGIIKFGGAKSSFLSETKNSITSIPFDSEFPQHFSFVKPEHASGCRDLRWLIIPVNIILSIAFGYIVSNAAGFYWPLFIMGFWTVILASNPPMASMDTNVPAELVSVGFRRFLPAMLCGYVIYVCSGRPLLDGLKANLSRAVFWLAGFWIGILENFVFGALPLDRLTVHDLNAQAGAWFAIITVILTILTIALGQAFVIWRCGKFKPYIQLYLGFAFLLFVLSLVPDQTLRIHHYILALIFLPGVGFKTTPALFYQGLLVGLFVAGIARWDFDSILQTYNQLRRGAPSLVGGIPELISPVFGSDLFVRWKDLPSNSSWDHFSLIVNDVERYRGPATNWSLTQFMHDIKPLSPSKFYVRLAYATKARTGDYTHAGVIDTIAQNWTVPKPGPL